VAGGLGLSVLSAHTLHGRAREHGVQVLPVAGFPLTGHWHVVHRQGRALSPVARVFREHLLGQAGRVAAEVAAGV
jgi:DNA-binding transcriptional LysR family regulator